MENTRNIELICQIHRCARAGVPAQRGLDPVEAELLAAVRQATAMPFADPVPVHGRLMSRRDARTIERVLVKLGRVVRA
jgi:hypothetical protein